MRRDEPLVATGSQTVGPFFHFGLTAAPTGRMIDRFPDPGTPIRLRVSVRDGDGEPVSDALIELWQAGVFGRMPTTAEGWCEFETVRPEGSASDGQAPHINVCLFARGLLRQLHTRVYFPAADLASDAVLALVPERRRATLFAVADAADPALWRFDIHLQGARETVFFDV